MSNLYLVRYAQVGSAADRELYRAEHIAYRKALGEALILAGPLLSDAGEAIGSVIIVAATDGSEAEGIATHDPFVSARLLQVTSIERLRIAALSPPKA